jgi:hypothetical protein
MTNLYDWTEVKTQAEYNEAYLDPKVQLECTAVRNVTANGDAVDDPAGSGGWLDEKTWPAYYNPRFMLYRRRTLV